MKNTITKIFAALLLLCGFMPHAKAQYVNTYETFLFNGKNPFGSCDSFVNYNYVSGTWKVASTFVFANDKDGYFSELRYRDSTGNLLARATVARNATTHLAEMTTSYQGGGTTPQAVSNIGYDANSNVSYESAKLYYSGMWIPTDSFTYTYDASNNMLTKNKVSWNGGTKMYDPKQKNTFTYNGSNKLTEAINSIYNSSGSSWQESKRYTYTYDGSGNLTGRLVETNSTLTTNWQNFERKTYLYNGIMKIRELTENYTGGNWVNAELDSSSSPLSAGSIKYKWSGSAWVISSKEECAHSGLTAPAAPTNLTASGVHKQADAKMKLTWTDNSSNEDGFIIQRSMNDTAWTSIDSVATDVINYTDSMLDYNTKYYYRVVAYNSVGMSGYSNEASATTLAGIKVAIGSLNVKLYPNPSDQEVTLNINSRQSDDITLTMTDINGRTLYSSHPKVAEGDNRIEINTSQLNSGVYLLRISSSEGILCQRLVISR